MLDLLPFLAMSFISEQHGSNMRPQEPLKICTLAYNKKKKIMNFLINALGGFFFLFFCIDIVLQMIDYSIS